MEAHAQSVEDGMLEGLKFNLGVGASYVTDRRMVTYYPQGGNEYSPTGVKVIKLFLAGDQWLDPSTLRIMFNLNNTHATSNLTPLVQSPHGLFRRLRIIAGGQVVEDIDYYNRTVEMFMTCTSRHHRENNAIEGFEVGSNDKGIMIPPLSHRTVSFSPLSGLFNQSKFLPIRYCPIMIELELLSTATDFCEASGTLSTSFTLSDVQLKADVITLDNAVDNDFAKHLSNGKSLPIYFSSYSTTAQVATGSNTQLNISRAVARLKSVFVTMMNPALATAERTEINLFSHPMNGTYSSANEVQFDLQIGSKKWPEYPMQSKAEAFYQLRKTLGLHSSAYHSLDITSQEYIRNRHIIAIDLEKALESSYTGYNSKSGDLLTIKLNNTGLDNTSRVFTTLHYDNILSIQDTGCQVYE